jgi:Tol biopolymer transport system component
MRGLVHFGVVCAVAALIAPAAASAATPQTVRVDLNSTGVQADSHGAENPAVSANGRWVVFESTATNLVANDNNNRGDVFLRDRKTGETKRLSVSSGGVEGNGASTHPSISGDGRWIAFTTAATNLVGGTAAFANVMLYDRTTGALLRISNAAGSINAGNGNSEEPRLSSDGSVVVFTSGADNLVAGDGGQRDVFMYRIATATLSRVSVSVLGGDPNGTSEAAAGSAEGRFVTFTSSASNLVATDTSGHSDVFVRDTTAGLTTRASVTSGTGLEANADSRLSTISSDGCAIAFLSNATDLVAGDNLSGSLKAFVRDRCAGSTEFASLANGGAQGAVHLSRPAISDDGCLVAMVTAGDNVLTPAASPWRVVVLRNRCQGFVSRVDVSTAGEGGAGHCDGVSLSAGTARYAVFHSGAQNLVAGTDGNGETSDTYLRDRATSAPPLAALQVVVDGRRVTADASASSDPDGEVAGVKIGFGDGSADSTGVAGVHEYARDGTFTVIATVTDDDGLSTTATRSVTIGGTGGGGSGPAGSSPLALSGATLSSRRIVVAPRGAHAVATLRVTASEAMSLTLTFERVLGGHRKGGHCSGGGGHGPRCTLYRAAGVAAASLVAGANSIPFSGRTGAGKALAPGRYRLALSGRSADGRTVAAAERPTFTIAVASSKKKGKR